MKAGLLVASLEAWAWLFLCIQAPTPTMASDDVSEKLEKLQETVTNLARQAMLLQHFLEEGARSDGDSGIKLLRGDDKGPENYFETGVVGRNFLALHDHSNYDRTIGMGEFIAVLNGVQFQTRHNDYKLKMASRSSTYFHATEDVPFPDVPPQVSAKSSVEDQITEMREWFKAFAAQDHSVRDYRKYFKPTLCYLEGAWTLDKALHEPFSSDRHHIDANSWADLQAKVRYTAYTGTSSRLQNFAALPRTIISINDGEPQYAQWNYRILCKPLEEDVPLRTLRQVDDMAARVPRHQSVEDAKFSRFARFRLYEPTKERFTGYGLLDRLMFTIPGTDNIPGNLTQDALGESLYSMASNENVVLKTGYYHRWYKFYKPGAMGIRGAARGFNDANMWAAQTTQEGVAPVTLETCQKKKVPVKGAMKWRKVCGMISDRFSWAIPLELIYLTPLHVWNPYNIETGKDSSIVTAGGRYGKVTEEQAYNGSSSDKYYLTPTDFFEGKTGKQDPADTVRAGVGVLDRQGKLRTTTASGIKVLLHNVEGIGKLRLRYPIAPIYGEGSPVWKELNALKAVVKADKATPTGPPKWVTFEVATAFEMGTTGQHSHTITIPYAEFRAMTRDGKQIPVKTSFNHDHAHDMIVAYQKAKDRYHYVKCGGKGKCRDGHPKELTLITDVKIEDK